MATYGLRYQSDFYNYFIKLVSIKIYQQDYSDSVEDDVRVQSVTITANYQDDNTPIIGKGAKIVMVVDTDQMGYLDSMLVSYEKQFLCVIEYDSEVVFRGYSICDLNEKQLLPFATITIEFTDYLHRLEGKYPDCLSDMGINTSVFALVEEILGLTDLDLPLYINSTLFEDNMASAATDTFLPQVYVQNANFYSNSFNYDNIYDAINKTLQPFSAFLYSYDDKWVIERQEDITRNGNWVQYSAGIATEVSGLKEEIYKQGSSGESYEYVDCSQIIEYDSGLQTLIISLRDKILDTLVFNNYTTDVLSVADSTPDAGTLDKNTWYKYTSITIDEIGTLHAGVINQYVKWTTDHKDHGLCYNFEFQFNDGSYESTQLTIEYKMAADKSLAEILASQRVRISFYIRFDGGDYSNYYLYEGDFGNFVVHPFFPEIPYATYATFTPDINQRFVFTVSKTMDLSEIWEDLGYPTTQKFTIIFLPMEELILASWEPILTNYLGDIKVSINETELDNKIEYHLNQNFIKTEEYDLHLFDLDNINYSNGLELSDGTRTNLWASENSAIACPLYEIFAKCKFRKYGRTIHRLKGTILIDKPLKPFTLITDDNITNESDEVITFLLNGFTWDLNKGTYDIEAEEYTEEEVYVEGVTYNSAGEEEGQTDPPETPTGIVADQLVHRGTILVDWNPVSNAIGYKLQRRPYYSGGAWVADYKIVYTGTATYFHDAVSAEGDPTGETFLYKVCAYNAAGDSAYSDPPVEVVWT